MTVSFKTSKDEDRLIAAIADRAVQVYGGRKEDWAMDVTAVHANGCPLDLAGLLVASPFDFAHDLGGIRDDLDRETGELPRFLPRYHQR